MTSPSSDPQAAVSPAKGRLWLSLAPALTVEETFEFGPLTITPICDAGDAGLAAVAARYANERGAHPDGQAVITSPAGIRTLVPTIWSLFVFACTSYGRRREGLPRGVQFPENFHLVSMTPTEHGWTYDSGHSAGYARAQHIPLRWPVDGPRVLREGWWDRRIELACRVIGGDPERWTPSRGVISAGMAADLTCAAFERHNQKVQNIAPGARTYVLLGAALEALHSKGSRSGGQIAIVKGVQRLHPGGTALGEAVYSDKGLKRPPRTEKGAVATRPMFAAAQLLHLRNAFAHGSTPPDSEYRLPMEMNAAHVMHVATLILAALIGQDLSKEIGCVVEDVEGVAEARRTLGLDAGQAYRVLTDGHDLLSALEEAIVPGALSSQRDQTIRTRR